MKPTPLPTSRPTSVPSGPSSQPSGNPTAQPSRQPLVHPTSQPSQHPSSQPTKAPSGQPSSHPASLPSSQPSLQPSISPTQNPTSQPTNVPSIQPTAGPSTQPSGGPFTPPSAQPSTAPSTTPSSHPSLQPSSDPTQSPSGKPSAKPSTLPSVQPSGQPSQAPTVVPSAQPSIVPSSQPSCWPSAMPSVQPTGVPSTQRSVMPSSQPSCWPSAMPSVLPTVVPSTQPSVMPSSQPSCWPSAMPSVQPSSNPSSQPLDFPTISPTSAPSEQPSCAPSFKPSRHPSSQPSLSPSCQPTIRPTAQPTDIPCSQPTMRPSLVPSSFPTTLPTTQPSQCPSGQPSTTPSNQPQANPTSGPSVYPSCQPSSSPSSQPRGAPSARPTGQPTDFPSNRPSSQPSNQPTCPTFHPTFISNGQLPSAESLSVRFEVVRNATEFRIVLPFQFVSYVPGDQFFDVAVKQPTFGSSYYLLGSTGRRLGEDIAIAELAVTTPSASYDFSGRSVTIAGDINGDGYHDLIIGVPFAAKVYVLFGTENGFVNMTRGFVIYGVKSSDMTGWSVSGAGDINNDTFVDIIIGAPHATNGEGKRQSGAVYVFYGMQSGFSNMLLSEPLLPTMGVLVEGHSSQEFLGLSVSSAGDMNGDGYDDVVVGVLNTNDMYSGTIVIVFGSPSDVVAVHEKSIITGSAWSWFGYSVNSAGDMNGDHWGDIVIGSLGRKTGVLNPVAYVMFGNRTFHRLSSVTMIDTIYGSRIVGGGVFVSYLGDVNDDHLSDVMISGADFYLNSGGGLTVIIAAQPPPVPSMSPSYQPSRMSTIQPSTLKPSQFPSVSPSLRPTQPTVEPTQAPSGPTFVPSVVPTQPSSVPTAVLSCPSSVPSSQPSVTPSNTPTSRPNFKPSSSPSSKPSDAPAMVRTSQPTTMAPSKVATKPSVLLPSRYPVLRPIAVPTVVSARHITYEMVEIADRESTVHYRTINNTHFIVNSTAHISVLSSSVSGAAKFTLMPNANTILTVQYFILTNDLMDLSAFASIHEYSDLNLTITNSSSGNPTISTIHLGGNQAVVLIYNTTTAHNLIVGHFVFAQRAGKPQQTHTDSSRSRVPVVGIVVGSLIIAVLAYSAYKCVWLQRDELIQRQIEVEPLSWEETENGNRTFVRFVQDDLLEQSLSTSGGGGDDSDSTSDIPSPVLSVSSEHKSGDAGESGVVVSESRIMLHYSQSAAIVDSGYDNSHPEQNNSISDDDYSQLSFGAYVGSGSYDVDDYNGNKSNSMSSSLSVREDYFPQNFDCQQYIGEDCDHVDNYCQSKGDAIDGTNAGGLW